MWRHIERHELDNGYGVVQHGLYVGTSDQLGRVIPLQDRPETAPLAGSVNAWATRLTLGSTKTPAYTPPAS